MDILQTKKCLHRVTTSQLLTKRTKKNTHTHTSTYKYSRTQLNKLTHTSTNIKIIIHTSYKSYNTTTANRLYYFKCVNTTQT